MTVKEVLDLVPSEAYVYINDAEDNTLHEGQASEIGRKYHDYDVGQLSPTIRYIKSWRGPVVQSPAIIIRI